MTIKMALLQPRMNIIENAISKPRLIRDDFGEFSDLAGSDEQAKAPIVAGIWNCRDVDNGSDIFEAEWDEFKYVLTGESLWKDADSGSTFIARPGSLLWFPTGSKNILIRSKDFSAIYVEQTYRPMSGHKVVQQSKLEATEEQGQPMAHVNLLERLKSNYIRENAKSREIHETAKLYLPGGNTRSVLYYEPFPMSLTTGHECFVTSSDGHTYLDFVSEYSACMFGHSNEEIQKTICSTVKQGMNLGGPGIPEIELARALVQRFHSIERIRFCNSGTEANTMALSIAKAFTKRKRILVFENGYHGGFLNFGSGSRVLNVEFEFVVAKYNDINSTCSSIDDTVAAILVEPMQGAGGMIPADKAFLQFLRDSATKYGSVLIFDEIITSRLHINGLQGYYGIHPDLTTLGKYLGGGFSFGAFGGRTEIMSTLDPSSGVSHSGTYNNNSFSMNAGITASSLLTADIIDRINSLGDQLRIGINKLARTYRFSMLTATGFGSAVGIHYTGPYADNLRDTLFFFMLSQRIYIGRRGFLSLNMAHQQTHIDQFLRSFENFLLELGDESV